MTIQQMLDQLAEFQAERDAIDLRRQELIDTILTPEIKAKIDDINLEFGMKQAAVTENIEALTTAVKAEVLKGGATCKGAHLMAVWVKGRVSWDGKKLDGMMALVPGLAAARSEGEPSVTIRRI